jgi:hypothetical protein
MTDRLRGRRIAMPAALVITIAGCSPGTAAIASPSTTTTATEVSSLPSPSATPYATPTATSSPGLELLPNGGKFEARTYATRFDPAFTFTLAGAGDANVDLPGWVDLSFEGDPGLAWNAVRLDRVFDPKHPGTLIDAPDDLPAWFAKLHGITPIAAAEAVRVGGLGATQLDFRNTEPVRFGPFPGIGDPTRDPSLPYFGFGESGNTFRLIILRGTAHHVVFRMWVDLCCSSPERASSQFASSMTALKAVMDSIVWAPRP